MSNIDKKELDDKISVLGVSCSGSRYKTNINYSYDDKRGCMVPNFDEVVDFYELIQSSKDSCDLNVIIERAKLGDVSVLNMNVPFYDDISDIPTDLNTRMALMQSIKDDFIKIKNSNIGDCFSDFDDFEKAVSDNTYIQRVNDFISARNAEKEKEVNNNA